RRLSTHYGPLSFTMRNENGSVRVSMQAGVRVPRGGVVVHSPFSRSSSAMLVNGVPGEPHRDGGVIVRSLPAEVVFRR
ncbi:MAG: hypothetical protein K0S86_3106, partial [Geminicoccaceae bacterium]|nr:hypothetical protein [Geminicoccaceae bacterium]